MSKSHKSLPVEKGNDVYKIDLYMDTEPIEKSQNMVFHTKLIVSKNGILIKEPELFQPILNERQVEEAMTSMKKWIDSHDQKTSNF